MRISAVLLPLWLLGIIFPPTLDAEYADILQFSSLIWMPMAGVFWGRGRFVLGPVFRSRPSTLIWTAVSLLAITASALLSADPARSLGYVATAAIGLMSCAGIWWMTKSRIPECLSVYAVLGTAWASYLYFFGGSRMQGRLTISAVAHANHLALISFGFLMCSLLVPSRILSGLLIGMNFLVIVATQSRGALVAALLGLLVYGTLKTVRPHKVKATIVLTGIALLCTVLLMIYQDPVEDWVTSLFFLNDKYRGIGTGFTGRFVAWQEALDLFLGNPWFGVGFRMHERYMTTLSSAHNGYLSLLAEVGLVGTISLFTLTALTGWRLLRQSVSGDPIAILGFSFVIGYLFLATFERYYLNMGNPTSILAWLFLLRPERSLSKPLLHKRRHQTVHSPAEEILAR